MSIKMADENLHRDIGKHDAQIEALQDHVDQLHADMRLVLSELQSIKTTLAEAKGGWRVLMWVGGAGGVAGAALHQLANWFLHSPSK